MFYEKMTIHCSTREEAADLMQMFKLKESDGMAEKIHWSICHSAHYMVLGIQLPSVATPYAGVN